MQTVRKSFEVRVAKVQRDHGLVFGFAAICTKGGKRYFDLQSEHIPEDVMVDFATDFMRNSRVAKQMHDGDPIGEVLFAFPLTGEIAKSLGVATDQTGLVIGMKPSAECLAKFASGEYKGFSIGGVASYVDDEPLGKAANPFAGKGKKTEKPKEEEPDAATADADAEEEAPKTKAPQGGQDEEPEDKDQQGGGQPGADAEAGDPDTDPKFDDDEGKFTQLTNDLAGEGEDDAEQNGGDQDGDGFNEPPADPDAEETEDGEQTEETEEDSEEETGEEPAEEEPAAKPAPKKGKNPFGKSASFADLIKARSIAQ